MKARLHLPDDDSSKSLAKCTRGTIEGGDGGEADIRRGGRQCRPLIMTAKVSSVSDCRLRSLEKCPRLETLYAVPRMSETARSAMAIKFMFDVKIEIKVTAYSPL